MATPEEIAAFRLTIGEPDETMYTNVSLSDRLDVTESADLAITIWREKAASYARLVDMQEGTSRRTLSQLMEHALQMVSELSGESGGSGSGTGRAATTRAIERI